MPHNDILAKLKDAVRSVSGNIQNYVSNPGDFSRNGKLPADVLMEFLIGQGSRSTRNELIDAFSYDKGHPSASALVQKRAKLSPAALRDVLYRFNQSLEPSSSNSNYRFFAADGSTLSFLSSSIFSSDDYFTTQGNSAKGAFSVHLTAFHDLDTNRYSDAVIQPISQKDEYGAFSTIVDRHPLPASAKAVFIADRGFCSYNNMAHVLQRGQFFLFRAKDIHSKGLLHHIDFPSADEFDVSVQLVIVRRQSKKLSIPDGYVRFVNKDTSFDFLEYGSDGFFVLPLRVVRFKLLSGEYEALVTLQPCARAVRPGVDLHLNGPGAVVAMDVDLPPVEPDHAFYVNDQHHQGEEEKYDVEPSKPVLFDHIRRSSSVTSHYYPALLYHYDMVLSIVRIRRQGMVV